MQQEALVRKEKIYKLWKEKKMTMSEIALKEKCTLQRINELIKEYELYKKLQKLEGGDNNAKT